jgi:MFS family permease
MGVVLVSTLLLRILGTGIWYLLPIAWAVIPLYNLYRFTQVPLLPPLPADKKLPLKELISSRGFIIALILMLCAGSSELTMSQWSSLFAEKGLHVPKVIGDLLGPCLFAIFMGIGRSIYGFWGHKIRLKPALLFCAFLCIICYAVTVFIPIPWIALLSCAVCGFAVSLMWPGTLSLTAATFPRGGTAMFGLLAVFGDLGGSVGPWLAGLVSDLAQGSSRIVAFGLAHNLNAEQIGLKSGLLLAIVFPLLLFIGTMLMKEPPAAAHEGTTAAFAGTSLVNNDEYTA